MKDYDVIIVGGGMVGAAAACGLGGSNLKVAVIEQLLPDPFLETQVHDLRVSALSLASVKIMESVGAWNGVLKRRLCPFRRMRVWETIGDTEFKSDDIHCQELGFIVENRVIQLALIDRLQTYDNVELIAPEKITAIDYEPKMGYTVIQLGNEKSVRCRVLVAADGGNSRVRQTVGIGVTSWDYFQHALVLNVETEYEQQDITWQRFVASGPQAFLPLSGNNGSLVWYNSADEVRRLKTLTDDGLMQELVAAFPDCLGGLKKILGRASFPLKRQHAQQYVKPGVALIGDAAHMINPLAGQGVNIGFLDAAALAEVLIEANLKGEEISSVNVLNRYEKMRRNDNLRMMTVMDAFYRVFSNDVLPVKFLRNLGLGLAERLMPAKTKVTRLAVGLEGNLPKLAKGQNII